MSSSVASPLPHGTVFMSQELEMEEVVSRFVDRSHQIATGEDMPHISPREEPPEPSGAEDQAAIPQLTAESMNGIDNTDEAEEVLNGIDNTDDAEEVLNGNDNADNADIQASIEDVGPVDNNVAETPATKSVRRPRGSASKTPASTRSDIAKATSISRLHRVTHSMSVTPHIENKTPRHQSKTPRHESKTPRHESKTPRRESKTPRRESKTPHRDSNAANGTPAAASAGRKRGGATPLSSHPAKKIKVVDDKEDEYEVEAIIDDGVDQDTFEHMYEVKWKGYDDTTWEPVKNLTHCKALIAEYEKKPTTSRNTSSIRGRGRGRGAGKTTTSKTASKATTVKPTTAKSSRGRGRGRGGRATNSRTAKAEAGKVAILKAAANEKAASNRARDARAAASASKRAASSTATAKEPRGRKATSGRRGRPKRSA